MKSKILAVTAVWFASLSAQASPRFLCHDTDTFTPMKITLEDDDATGPVLKIEGHYSGQVLHKLGLMPAGAAPFEYKNLTITLPGQPTKRLLGSDPNVRDYTRFGLTGTSVAEFSSKNQVIQKEVTFEGLDIMKLVTASAGTSYVLSLRLSHSGKHWDYSKNYYNYSCR